MNNEEKILTLLEKLVTDVAELKAKVTKLENDFAEQKAELKAVQALQMQDYNLLLSIDKKVDKLSAMVHTHEKRFMKMREALSA